MASRILFLAICFCFLTSVANAQEHRIVASIPCYESKNTNRPIPISPSCELYVVGEGIRNVLVRHVNRPYEVWASIPITDLDESEVCTPITFETDSLLLLSATMKGNNHIIAVNIFTREVQSYPIKEVQFHSKHGRGLVFSSYDVRANETTWSFFDGMTGTQRQFAKGGPRGTVIRNGDFLLQEGNLLKWYLRSTGELFREVTVPSQYNIDTNEQFADSDESRQRLYISVTNGTSPMKSMYLDLDFDKGTVRERPIIGMNERENITVSPSGRFVSIGNGWLCDVTTGFLYDAQYIHNRGNIVFVGDTAFVGMSIEGLVRVNIQSAYNHHVLAVPWLGSEVNLSGSGKYVMNKRSVLDMSIANYRYGIPNNLIPVAGGRQFARREARDNAEVYDIITDASTLEDVDTLYVGTIYDTDRTRAILDCDIEAGLVLEQTGDTSILITNYSTRKSVRFRNPDILQPRYRTRLLSSLNCATVIGEYGTGVIRNVTSGRILRSQLPFISVSGDIAKGILPLSHTVSSAGDILVTAPGRACVMTFDEQGKSNPDYVDVEPYRFYGFTVDDKVAMVTRSGDYVLYDKQMNLIRRDKIADTISNDSWWAHLSYSGDRLLIANAKDRIDVYDVSGPVSVDSEAGDTPAATNLFWPSSTTLTLPGTVVSIHDELGRDQRERFKIHPASDGSTLSTTMNTRGLFIVRMADGTARLLYCE